MNLFSEAHIFKTYSQVATAIIRLIHPLVVNIADLEAQLVRSSQPVIAALSKELSKFKRTLARKTDELINFCAARVSWNTRSSTVHNLVSSAIPTTRACHLRLI